MDRSTLSRLATIGLLLALGAGTVPAQPLDLDNPDDAVRAMRKLQCHLEDGKPAIYAWTGNAYSRVPGERDRLLFRYEGMNIRACGTVEEAGRGYGYRMVSREVLVYLDPETGEVVDRWTNPWTGKEVEVVHISNDPVSSRAPTFAQGSRGPYRFGATLQDGRGWMSFEVPLFYPNVLGGEYQPYVGGTYHAMEMFSFYFDADRLLDRQVTGLDDAHVGWTRVGQWLPWMEMGSRVGSVMYHGAGKRVRSFEDLPDTLRRVIDERYPEYRQPPPVDDTRPNETSWSFYKKHLDAQRAAESEK